MSHLLIARYNACFVNICTRFNRGCNVCKGDSLNKIEVAMYEDNYNNNDKTGFKECDHFAAVLAS